LRHQNADPENCYFDDFGQEMLDEYWSSTKVAMYKNDIYLYYNTNIKYKAAAQGACKNFDRNCSNLKSNEKHLYRGQSWVGCKSQCDSNSKCTGFAHRPDNNDCEIVFKQNVDPDTCDVSSKWMCNVKDPDHEGPHLRKVDSNSRHLLFNLDAIADEGNVARLTCGEFLSLPQGEPLRGARLEQSPNINNHNGGALYVTDFMTGLKDQIMDRNAFETYFFDETKIQTVSKEVMRMLEPGVVLDSWESSLL